jgi:hypothetical protein
MDRDWAVERYHIINWVRTEGGENMTAWDRWAIQDDFDIGPQSDEFGSVFDAQAWLEGREMDREIEEF